MLTAEQRASYDRDGFLAVPGVVDRETCAELVQRAAEIAAAAPAEKSVFTTKEQERVSDERFLASGPQITCFTEPDGVTLAKIGHALHDLDPVFAPFSHRPDFAELLADVGMTDPLLLQSMYLCKAAHSGGEVGSHQDATFLWTDPVTVTGIWVALEDATVDNGCLWALPGGHRTVPLAQRFVRLGGDADGTAFEDLARVDVPEDGWVPLEATAGTVVLLHGLLPHRSSPNTSPRSRAAYSLHAVSAGATYPADNWLQRPAAPARLRLLMPTLEQVRRAPKVLLHDHLDGGLRPATVIELAAEAGYADLPTTDVEALGRWFTETAGAGSLPLYLETFRHTVGVMQTREALVRVARECAEDLADDGVVYAEVRYAPELHLEGDLTLPEVVEAVQEGYRQGCAGRPIRVVTLLTAMRHAARSLEIAELAVRYRASGVVGFDIAGAEAGFPPSRHLAAFQHMQRANGHYTIHAGEGFGLPSIWEALQECHADRLGHGVRIVDDIELDTDGRATLGPLAQYVRDCRIPLELCPSSNVQTGAAPSIAEHPIGLLRALQFRVTVNTDNRLMSGVSVSSELYALVEAFGYGWDDLRWLTINGMKSAFLPFDQRLRIIDEVIKPGYAALSA